MQRAAEARTSTSVSSISRMTMRIIFAGSSDRSSISVMFAAKISRVREKMLIHETPNSKIRALNLLFAIQGSCHFRENPRQLRKAQIYERKQGENPCQMVGFATNSRREPWSGQTS